MKKNSGRLISIILVCILLSGLVSCSKENQIDANRTPDFEAQSININLSTGTPAEYKTICKTDQSKETVGTLSVESIYHFAAADDLPSKDLEPLEGYEWIQVKIKTEFYDENAREYGIDRSSTISDYYDVVYFENSLEYKSDGVSTFSVKKDGVVFDACQFIKVVDNQGWTAAQKNICNYTWYFRVPEGYDGIIIAYLNAATKQQADQQIYDIFDNDSLILRVL